MKVGDIVQVKSNYPHERLKGLVGQIDNIHEDTLGTKLMLIKQDDERTICFIESDLTLLFEKED